MYRTIISIFLCNFIEWYDFILYGHMSYIFSRLFFPNYSSEVSAILSLGTFAVAFIARPIGALIFGYVGDRFGRKKSLIISIRLMFFSTICFFLMPTFQNIGIAAPILLVIVRIIQGISFGGEAGGLVLIAEHSPKDKVTLLCGFFPFSTVAGVVVGYLVVNFFIIYMGNEAFGSWGWRIPFLIGAIMTSIVLILRTKLAESILFLTDKKHDKLLYHQYLTLLLTEYKVEFILACGLYALSASSFYIFTIFIDTISFVSNERSTGLIIYCLLMLVVGFAIVISAYLAGKVNRVKVLIFVSLVFILSAYPLYYFISCGKLIAYIMLGILVGLYIGPIHSVSISLFPTYIRQTSFNLSYNVVGALFGGPAPAISLWLITLTQAQTAPSMYLIFCALISLISAIIVLKRSKFYL